MADALPSNDLTMLRRALTDDDPTTRLQALGQVRSLEIADFIGFFNGCALSMDPANAGRVSCPWLSGAPPAEFLQAFLGGPRLGTDTYLRRQGFDAFPVLDLSGVRGLRDLSLLAGFGSLQALKADHCPDLSDIAALSSMTQLAFLSLRGTGGVPLGPVANLHLRHLDVRDCGLEWADIPSPLRQRRLQGAAIIHVHDALDSNYRYALSDWQRVNGVELVFKGLEPGESVLVTGRADDHFSHFAFGAEAAPGETATLHHHDPAEVDGHVFFLLPQPPTPAGMSDGELEKWRFYGGLKSSVAALAGTGWGVYEGQRWR